METSIYLFQKFKKIIDSHKEIPLNIVCDVLIALLMDLLKKEGVSPQSMGKKVDDMLICYYKIIENENEISKSKIQTNS